MGIIKSKGFVIACVAAIAIIAGLFFGNPFAGTPKAEATTATKPVYPERGYTNSVVLNDKGVVTGCDKDVASTELADSGGMVSVNGLFVKSEWTSEAVIITFSGDAVPFVSGFVIGSEATEPFNMPTLEPNEVLDGITLDTNDFSKSGKFQDIVLCGGGL